MMKNWHRYPSDVFLEIQVLNLLITFESCDMSNINMPVKYRKMDRSILIMYF